MTSIIRIEKLSKYFMDGSGNKLQVIDQIDAIFNEGQSASIMGRSGSGKSTLLNLLGGLELPSSGKVFFKEENILNYNNNKLSKWRNRSVGFVFQSHNLLGDFSALENVMIPALILGRSKLECIKRAEELLERVDLKKRASHKPSRLSGGEQQRVAVARALMNSPDIILADEPTGNLDAGNTNKVSLLLRQICRRQRTALILVSHDAELAAGMDCRYQLRAGRLAPIVADHASEKLL